MGGPPRWTTMNITSNALMLLNTALMLLNIDQALDRHAHNTSNARRERRRVKREIKDFKMSRVKHFTILTEGERGDLVHAHLPVDHEPHAVPQACYRNREMALDDR